MTTRHLTEEDLILHRYGEAEQAGSIEEHLASCLACRGESERLAADLGLLDRLAVPERDEAYGAAVWRGLRPRLMAPERPAMPWWRPLALATVAAALLAAAFLAGRFWRVPPAEGRSAPEVRERILLVAVGDHLDRTQMALLEFVHTPAASAESPREGQRAAELVAANRLYRQTASRAGEAGVASVLEDIERLLLEIAHAPTPEAREALRRRIESEGTIFKVRVIRTQVREREKSPVPPAARS